VSVTGVILFLGLFGWMWLARIIRGEFLSLKRRDFVEAARSVGAPDGRIIRRHLLPNVLAPIIVSTTLNVAYYMLAEASLSFLGFGVPSGTPTWGNMLNAARTNYLTHPILAVAPGLAHFPGALPQRRHQRAVRQWNLAHFQPFRASANRSRRRKLPPHSSPISRAP
jgi:ABC-type dipeptide/oligopeptide/nickel transport system permease subunit